MIRRDGARRGGARAIANDARDAAGVRSGRAGARDRWCKIGRRRARARAANGGDGGRRDGRESAPMAVAAASLSIKPFARAGTGRGRRKTDGEPRTRAIVTCADKK